MEAITQFGDLLMVTTLVIGLLGLGSAIAATVILFKRMRAG